MHCRTAASATTKCISYYRYATPGRNNCFVYIKRCSAANIRSNVSAFLLQKVSLEKYNFLPCHHQNFGIIASCNIRTHARRQRFLHLSVIEQPGYTSVFLLPSLSLSLGSSAVDKDTLDTNRIQEM